MTCYALIPAAGGGTRMGAEIPKQYLPLLGKPLIWHALRTLVDVPSIAGVYVVLAPGDERWSSYDWTGFGQRMTVLRCGGGTRAESVMNGLKAMSADTLSTDWILVHDAARCCLSTEHVDTLIATVADDPVGGLLAVPVADTLKRAGAGERVAVTVSREHLWQAQTPQMFRYGLLCDALAHAPAVTDEASAVEAMGLQPKLVRADATNLKVTFPLDLQIAAGILANRRT